MLATATDEMKENLGSHPMGPAKEAYRRRLERLLNNPEVAKVLGAAPPAAPEPKPTEPTPTEPASGSAGEPPPVPAEDKPNAGEPPPVPAEDKAKGTTPAPPAEG